MRRKVTYLFLIIISIYLIGCGKKTEAEDTETLPNAGAGQLSDAWMAVPLTIPHDVIYGETLFQNDLYYISYENGNQAVLAGVPLDNPEDIRRISLSYISPEEDLTALAAGGGELHILTFQYERETEAFMNAFWYRVNENGEMIQSAAIGEAIRDCAYYWVHDFSVDAVGNAYLAIGGDVFILTQAGDLMHKITCGTYVSNLYQDVDERVYVLYSEGPARMMAVIDAEEGTLSASRDISSLGDVLGFGLNAGDLFFLADIKGANEYNLESRELTERFSWFSVNVAAGYGDKALPLADGRILWVDKKTEDSITGKPTDFHLIRLMTAEEMVALEAAKEERARKRLEEEAAAKVANEEAANAAGAAENTDVIAIIPTGVGNITLGVVGGGLTTAVSEAIMEFNRINPDSRIEIKEYGNIFYGREDYDDGTSALNLDIASGKCPDVLLFPREFSYGLYARKGLFKDLHPYILGDVEFDLKLYQENIIKAYEIEGKLLGMPLVFNIAAFVGKAADLGGKTEWTMDELIAFADRFPESNIFQYPTKTNVLDFCLKANGENIVDWSGAGSGGVDRDLFVKMLTFANRFANDDTQFDWNLIPERARGGDVRIRDTSVFASIQYEMELFGEAVSYIGYPSEKGSGYLISSRFIAITNHCAYEKTAWEFVKHLLADEFQSHREIPGYPVSKVSLEARIEQEKKPTGTMSGSGGITFEQRDVTGEELESFYYVLHNANKIRVFDHQVDAIIKEEAGAYFYGNKNVDEVADIVENRVGIYVMEFK